MLTNYLSGGFEARRGFPVSGEKPLIAFAGLLRSGKAISQTFGGNVTCVLQ
jgi:hypothetical protein